MCIRDSDYVDQNGETLLKPVIMQEVEQIGAQSTKDLTSHFRLNEAFVHDMLDHIYEHVVREKADTVLDVYKRQGRPYEHLKHQ